MSGLFGMHHESWVYHRLSKYWVSYQQFPSSFLSKA
jgi:hypothetical protein